MAKHDGFWTGVRMLAVRWLEPQPYPGEAWCVNCCLNSCHTVLLPLHGLDLHEDLHRRTGPAGHTLRFRCNYPPELS